MSFIRRKSSPVPEGINEITMEPLPSDHNFNSLSDSELSSVVYFENVSVMEHILSIGYRIDVINASGQTPLLQAFSDSKGETLNSILHIDSIFFKCEEEKNYTDKFGLSHLHVACAAGFLDVVKYFVERGEDVNARCDVVDGKNFEDYAALHFAVRYKRKDVIMYLLQNGADVGSFSSMMSTPLHAACEDHSLILGIPFDDCGTDIMKILLDHGSCIDARDRNGRTPIMCLFVDYLCRSFDSYDIYSHTYHNNRKILCDNRHRLLKKFIFCLHYAKADLQVKCKLGCTVLHYAVENLWSAHKPNWRTDVHFDDDIITEIMQILLGNGVDVNEADKTGRTALETAVAGLSVEAVILLLNWGANVNTLKFDRKCVENSGKFFVSTDQAPPSLEAVENLFDILELLSDKGWTMRLQDCLSIMEFLVWPTKDYIVSEDDYWFNSVETVLHYGTPRAVKDYCAGILESEDQKELRDKVEDYIHKMNVSKFYVDQELKEMFNISLTTETHMSLQLIKELATMKEMVYAEEITLYDIMTMHPDQIYRYLRDKKYRKFLRNLGFDYAKIDKPFPICNDIIRGHFAKCLTRKFILRLARDHLKPVVFPRLPYVCSDIIFDHLSNENLLNLCLSALPPKKNEKKYFFRDDKRKYSNLK